ncbi:1747_t:CDS:2, partial [Funneliformis geosporum]
LLNIQEDLSTSAEIIIASGDLKAYNEATECWICKKPFLKPSSEALQKFEEAKHRLLELSAYGNGLDKLVECLGGKLEKFLLTVKYFTKKGYSIDKIKLLFRKGVFLYDWTNAWKKFDRTSLPSRKNFYSLLNVFMNYTIMCLQDDSLDPSHYVSALGMFNDSLYKSSNAELKLMTDMDEYLIVENDYESSKPKSWIMYEDINTLYSGAITQNMLTEILGKVSPEEIPNIQSITPDAEIGYMLEVDLESSWIKNYIEENIRKCKIAKANGDEFRVMYYKLKNNVIFGKQMENVRKHMRVELLRINEDKKIRHLASSPLYVDFKAFEGDITAQGHDVQLLEQAREIHSDIEELLTSNINRYYKVNIAKKLRLKQIPPLMKENNIKKTIETQIDEKHKYLKDEYNALKDHLEGEYNKCMIDMKQTTYSFKHQLEDQQKSSSDNLEKQYKSRISTLEKSIVVKDKEIGKLSASISQLKNDKNALKKDFASAKKTIKVLDGIIYSKDKTIITYNEGLQEINPS